MKANVNRSTLQRLQSRQCLANGGTVGLFDQQLDGNGRRTSLGALDQSATGYAPPVAGSSYRPVASVLADRNATTGTTSATDASTTRKSNRFTGSGSNLSSSSSGSTPELERATPLTGEPDVRYAEPNPYVSLAINSAVPYANVINKITGSNIGDYGARQMGFTVPGSLINLSAPGLTDTNGTVTRNNGGSMVDLSNPSYNYSYSSSSSQSSSSGGGTNSGGSISLSNPSYNYSPSYSSGSDSDSDSSSSYANGGVVGQPPNQPGLAMPGAQAAPMSPQMMDAHITDLLQRNPQVTQRIQQTVQQAIQSGQLNPQLVHQAVQLCQACVNNPSLWPQLRQYAIRQGLCGPNDLPQQYDQGLVLTILAAAKAVDQGTPQLSPQAQGQGPVQGRADGGQIYGPGTGTSDSVEARNTDTGAPVNVSNGEYVIPQDVVATKGREFFDNLVRKYHTPAAMQRRGQQ